MLSIVVGGLVLSYAPFIERMQILGARRIDTKSQRATATINIRPARLITIKYDCTLAIKRDSLVRGKDTGPRNMARGYISPYAESLCDLSRGWNARTKYKSGEIAFLFEIKIRRVIVSGCISLL